MTTVLIVIMTAIFIIVLGKSQKELKHTKQLLNEVYDEDFDFEIKMYERFIQELKGLVNTYSNRQLISLYTQKIVDLEETRKYFTKSTNQNT